MISWSMLHQLLEALFAGGYTGGGGTDVNTIEYVTIATVQETLADFGDMTVAGKA